MHVQSPLFFPSQIVLLSHRLLLLNFYLLFDTNHKKDFKIASIQCNLSFLRVVTLSLLLQLHYITIFELDQPLF